MAVDPSIPDLAAGIHAPGACPGAPTCMAWCTRVWFAGGP